MFGNLSGPTLLVILFIVLLLFGAPKLPALARSIGQSMKILKKEVTTNDGEADTAPQANASDVKAAEAEHDTPSASTPAPKLETSDSVSDDELAAAKAEAAAAKAEAEALRAAAAKRDEAN